MNKPLVEFEGYYHVEEYLRDLVNDQNECLAGQILYRMHVAGVLPTYRRVKVTIESLDN